MQGVAGSSPQTVSNRDVDATADVIQFQIRYLTVSEVLEADN